MPLKYDPEFRLELENSLKKHVEGFGFFRTYSMALTAALFLALIFFRAESQTLVTEAIALGTVILVWLINKLAREITLNLAANASIAEWVGRKQLGEYNAPGTDDADN